jgi:hypothetical protein
VVDDVGDVELVDVAELVEDDEVEVEVDVLVLGGRLVVVVVVGRRLVEVVVLGRRLVVVVMVGACVELVVDAGRTVTVVERWVLLVELDVLVDPGIGCVVRVVLVVLGSAGGRLVDVVLAATGSTGQPTGAGAFRAANRRGRSCFTAVPAKSMQ